MFWKLEWGPGAEKAFKKLDQSIQKKIQNYFNNKVLNAADPLVFAKPLKHNLSDYYSFRVESYRIMCSVEKMKLIITVVKVDHRRDVYN